MWKCLNLAIKFDSSFDTWHYIEGAQTRDDSVLHNQSDGVSLCCMNTSHRDLIIIDCHKKSHPLNLKCRRESFSTSEKIYLNII